jgi:prephenate dehydratase
MAKRRGEAQPSRGPARAAAANTIAFQGEAGANSDMACRAAYPYMTTLPCPTFETAMAAVQADRAELAMIPVENSIAGRVADLHSLLPHTRLKIVAEHFQRVEHCLVALPGATLKTVRTVKSHVQALAQCRNFLKKHRFAPLVHADTAGAAREIAEQGDASVGAIASSLAARIYDLKVLARNIEDADHNTTRMLVFSRDEAAPDWRTVRCMTAFLFRVKSVPAALYKALGGFATNGINIVKLESYLSGAHFEQAQFYAEVEGHPEQRGLTLALEELSFFSEEFKPLGTFPAHPFRRKGWEAPTRPGT